jgi:hypothetical protein
MTTPKAAIKEFLATLDLADDTNWTEDGSPSLSVIQKALNDTSISRAQINDAYPGFARVSPDEVKKTYNEPAAAEPAAALPDVLTGDVRLTDDQMRTILTRRIRDAEQALLEATQHAADATAEVVACQKRLGRAHTDHQRQFPPITPAANIKAHLASLAAAKEAEISPLQAALTGRKRPIPGRTADDAAKTAALPRRSGASVAA